MSLVGEKTLGEYVSGSEKCVIAREYKVSTWTKKKNIVWEDKWLGQDSLKNKYLRMYANSCRKEVKVCTTGLWSENL